MIKLDLLRFLKEVIKKINNYKNIFSVDIQSDTEFLQKYKEPNNNIERSYFQYKCQNKKQNFTVIVLQNLIALILIPIYYIKIMNNRNSSRYYSFENEKCAVFLSDGIGKSIIPNSLQNEFDKIIESKLDKEMYIRSNEKAIICLLVKKYWYSPYFIFKNMIKVSIYASKIIRYNPKAIISYSEYSFTSSLLTEYCNMYNIEHINVMHGEKLFNIRDSFVSYDRYYVWDDYYIKLLTELRAKKNQFVIEIPSNVKLNINNSKLIYDFTYYLGGENVEELLKIRNNLLKINSDKSKLCIRFHPRYSNIFQVNEVFEGFKIEDPHKTSLEESLSLTKQVVSLYSTVLYQAYENGKSIIIDDMVDVNYYRKLSELKYIMLEKPHKVLSDYINKY